MVAYTCVQVLFRLILIQLFFDNLQLYVSLSSMKEWDSLHNYTDLTVFYNHIVRIMKDNSDDEWYNQIVQNLTE